MAKSFLLFLTCIVLLEGWAGTEVPVFLSKNAAESILRRYKRYNSGGLEELKRDNLERECMEEQCSFEEAREVFENGEKTMEFWVSYQDGDQCKSDPCQNGGQCKDGMSSYTCWCPVGFTGKNCEIDTERQCDINNGGCVHFCQSDKFHRAECDCANGYKLSRDGRSCSSEAEFPCGRIGKNVIVSQSTRTIETHITSEVSGTETPVYNHTGSPPNITEGDVTTPPPENNTTLKESAKDLPSLAFSPTLPTIQEKLNIDDRIVGGNEVTPGEVPWQVALIDKETAILFCGGTILGELWVITAAHCLENSNEGSFFIRVGEHNTEKDEGMEQNHMVAKVYLHPRYQKGSKYNHDIALLQLQTPITFSEFALPICLGPKEFTESLVKRAPHSLISGWGKMRFDGANSPVLQKVEVPFVERTECKGSSNDHISHFMFCAGYHTDKKDACQGDSGGPHVTLHHNTWFLTGIISWGEGCAKEGKYGIYTRVSRYYNWISSTTGIKLNHM